MSRWSAQSPALTRRQPGSRRGPPPKRIPDPFEERLLGSPGGCGARRLVVDKWRRRRRKTARVERARYQRSGVQARLLGRLLRGIRVPCVAASRLYVGYDLRRAARWLPRAVVPQISIFAGFPAPRIVPPAGAPPASGPSVVSRGPPRLPWRTLEARPGGHFALGPLTLVGDFKYVCLMEDIHVSVNWRYSW